MAFVDDAQLAGRPGEEAGLRWVRERARAPGAPGFVLATAFRQHALEAFNLGVADYLLKPFTEERIEDCLRRLLARPRTPRPAPRPQRIVARRRRALVFLDLEDVWACEASDRLTYVHSTRGRFDLDLTLSAIAGSFGRALVQVHRQWLVNPARVLELDRDAGETSVLVGNASTTNESAPARTDLLASAPHSCATCSWPTRPACAASERRSRVVRSFVQAIAPFLVAGSSSDERCTRRPAAAPSRRLTACRSVRAASAAVLAPGKGDSSMETRQTGRRLGWTAGSLVVALVLPSGCSDATTAANDNGPDASGGAGQRWRCHHGRRRRWGGARRRRRRRRSDRDAGGRCRDDLRGKPARRGRDGRRRSDHRPCERIRGPGCCSQGLAAATARRRGIGVNYNPSSDNGDDLSRRRRRVLQRNDVA